MTVYQEDPFQLIRNVGWGARLGVLAWRSFWKGVLDDPNNAPVSAGPFNFHLFDNPASVIDGGRVFVLGRPPYKSTDIETHVGATSTISHYTYTGHFSSGPDSGIGFGTIANHTVTTDGLDFWSNPFLAGTYPSLDALVFAAGWNDGYSDLVLVSVSTSKNPDVTTYTVEHNALIFFRLAAFSGAGLTSLPIQFDTGLRPFPDETVSPYYKWKATVATFRSATMSTFTNVNDVPDAWIDTKSVSKLSFGDAALNQPTEYLLNFAIDLTTLAVSGSRTITG